jgi:hypothetical protein
MNKDTIVILIVSGILLFIWLPVLIFSIRRALRRDQTKKSHKL